MLMEVFRNLRCHLLANGDEWLHDLNMPASPLSTVNDNDDSFLNAMTGPRGGRSRRNMGGAPGGVASRMATGRMPELEETDIHKQQQQQQQEEGEERASQDYYYVDKENTDPLEPAFLRDDDYPPGWLVFDPILGVVSKAEADKDKREQRIKRELQQQTQKKAQQSLAASQTKSPMRQQSQQQQQQQQQQPNLHPKQHSISQQQPTAKPSTSTATTRPLRTNNVMPNASPAMHFSQNSIAANG